MKKLNVESANPRDYNLLSDKFKRMLGKHEGEVLSKVETSRQIRFMPHVAPAMKAKGELKQGETYIPVRLVDTNIRKEHPEVVKYLTQPARTLVLSPKDADKLPSETAQEPLERDFTDKARYENWETPWIKGYDGAATFGYDAVRVDFDLDYEGHFVVTHVGRENLVIDTEIEGSLNAQEMVGLRVPMTGFEILEHVESGNFDADAANQLIASVEGKSDQDNVNKILNVSHDVYEILFKVVEDGETYVYTAWWAKGCSGFLSKAAKLFLGRRDMAKPIRSSNGIQDFEPFYEKDYNVFLIRYSETENSRLNAIKGRVELDEADQDAASALLSSIVNGAIASVPVYMAPAQNPSDPDMAAKPPKVVSKKMANELILDKPTNFQTKPGPDTTLLSSYQMLMGKNAAEQSRVDIAAKNRRDSRKTAAEIKATTAEANERSNVQLVLFSQTYVAAYSLCFSIYRNRVLLGRIAASETVKALLAAVRYNLRSAGDVDVVERQAKEEKLRAYAPMVAGTPLALVFLKRMLIHAFPEMSEEIEKALQEHSQDKGLIQTLHTMVKQLSTGPEGELKPELDGLEEELAQLDEAVAASQGQTEAQPV